MIESIRVDDRLIHGQVALVWSKEFNSKRIVVANDEAAVNEVQQMTLNMATPDGIKLLIKSVDDSIKVFSNPKSKELSLFVLTSNVADALKIVKNCSIVKDVNVANVGRFDETPDKIALNDAILLNNQELKALKELSNLDLPVYHQVVPNNKRLSIQKLLEQ